MGGYIKLDRALFENPWISKDHDYLLVVVYLLKDAAYTEFRTVFNGETITLKPGQLITGRKKLAEEAGVEEHKVQRVLNRLESEHLIEQQKSNKGSLITVLFGTSDSESEQQNEQLVSSNRAASEQLVSTIKRNKEVKKEIKEKDVSKDTSKKKVERTFSDNPDVDKAIKDFLAYRKRVKKAEMTDRAINSMLNKLKELATDPAEQIKLLDYAMEHNWMTVYPIRGEPMNTRAAPEPEFDQAAYDHLNKVLDEMEASGNASW